MNPRSPLFLLSLFLLGCGSGGVSADRPETQPVTGTVLYNGSPVEGALVTFRPNLGKGQGAYATTDENGVFELTTFESGDGAATGEYAVMISKKEITAGDPSYGDPDSPNYGKDAPPEAESKTIYLLPEKYGDITTSGLSANVKEEDNDFTFELTD